MIHADELMLFGTPFSCSRSFENIFRHKVDIEYAHHVFRQMAIEFRGNSRASYALYAHYQKRLRQSWELAAKESAAAQEGLFDKQSWSAKEMKDFRRDFDKVCFDGFVSCLSGWNDYTEPIVSAADFTKYLEKAKAVFKRQWDFLASLRNVNKKRTERNYWLTRRGKSFALCSPCKGRRIVRTSSIGP